MLPSSAQEPRARSFPRSCTARRGGVVAFGLDKIDPDKDIKISLHRGRGPHRAGAAAAYLGSDHGDL